jgi:hypothetical protein
MNAIVVYRLPQIVITLSVLLYATCDQAPKTEPPISDIDWALINAIYNAKYEKTDLQKDERWKEFKGKKVKWTGDVVSAEESMFGTLELRVKMNPDTFGTFDLLIKLKDSQRSRAARLNKGDSVTFTGILDYWGSSLPIIPLNNAEIVD